MPWLNNPTINSPSIIPNGPGDRVAGDIAGGRTPAPGDLAAVQKAGLLPQVTALGQAVREYGVWLIIIVIALIGVWGLVSPGGGVAVIDRFRR